MRQSGKRDILDHDKNIIHAINDSNELDKANAIKNAISESIAAKRESVKSIQTDISQLFDMFRLQLIHEDKAKEKIHELTQKKELLEKDIQVGILSLDKEQKEIRSIVLKQSNNVTLQNATPQSIPTSISTKATSSVMPKLTLQQRPQIPAQDDYEGSNYDDDAVENSSFQGYNHLNSDYDYYNENNHYHVDNEEEKIITLDDIKSIFHPTIDKKLYEAAETLFDQADTGLTDVSVETKFNDLSLGNIYKCYYRGNDKDQESQEEVISFLEYFFIVVDRRMIGETSSRSRSTTSNVIYDIVAYKKPNSMRHATLESSKVQKKLKFYLQTDKKVDTNRTIMDEDDEDLEVDKDLEDDEDKSLKCLDNNNNNRKKKNTNELPTRQNSPRKAKQQKTA